MIGNRRKQLVKKKQIKGIGGGVYFVIENSIVITRFIFYKKHAYKKHEAEIWVNQKCYLPKYWSYMKFYFSR